MQIKDFLGYFSSNLEIIQDSRNIKIIDKYHENDSEFDYGVWDEFENKTDLINRTKGDNCIYMIPDIYIEGYIDFLINDDFPNHYCMSKETVESIEIEVNKYGFIYLDEICKKYGELKAYEDLKQICSILKGNEQLEYEDINIDTKYNEKKCIA